jgi:putative endonuclease
VCWATQLAVRVLDAILPAPKEAEHLRTGRRGEELAYFYLRKRKYVIVARNFRTPWHKSELDLVGWNEGVLCFIEVKTRTTRDVAPAEAAVDEEKRHDLRRVARHYLRQMPEGTPTRFDIVTVYLDKPKPEITIIKSAFAMKEHLPRRH